MGFENWEVRTKWELRAERWEPRVENYEATIGSWKWRIGSWELIVASSEVRIESRDGELGIVNCDCAMEIENCKGVLIFVGGIRVGS